MSFHGLCTHGTRSRRFASTRGGRQNGAAAGRSQCAVCRCLVSGGARTGVPGAAMSDLGGTFQARDVVRGMGFALATGQPLCDGFVNTRALRLRTSGLSGALPVCRPNFWRQTAGGKTCSKAMHERIRAVSVARQHLPIRTAAAPQALWQRRLRTGAAMML